MKGRPFGEVRFRIALYSCVRLTASLVKRMRMLAICARVALPRGLITLADRPVIYPLAFAHFNACLLYTSHQSAGG